MNIERPDDELDFGDELETEITDETPAPAAPAPAPAPAAAAPATAAKPIPQTIPYDRFAKVNDDRKRAEDAAAAERERAIRLEEQLRLLQQAQQAPAAPPAPPIDEGEIADQFVMASVEGNREKLIEALGKLKSILKPGDEFLKAAEERAIARLRAEQAEALAKAQATELEKVALQVVETYPFLNSESPDADRDAIEDVIALRDRNIAKGMTQAAALQKAVERYKPLLDAKLAPKTPAAAGESTRAAEAKLRNARAAASQPPLLDTGMSPGAAPQNLDIDKISREAWSELPDAEREKYLV